VAAFFSSDCGVTVDSCPNDNTVEFTVVVVSLFVTIVVATDEYGIHTVKVFIIKL